MISPRVYVNAALRGPRNLWELATGQLSLYQWVMHEVVRCPLLESGLV